MCEKLCNNNSKWQRERDSTLTHISYQPFGNSEPRQRNAGGVQFRIQMLAGYLLTLDE